MIRTLFSGLVLWVMAREGDERGTDLLTPRSEGIASRMGMSPDSRELVLAERYLVREGYIAPADPERPDGPYTITPTGWMDLGYRPTAEGLLRRRPWWKRLLRVQAGGYASAPRITRLGDVTTTWAVASCP